MTRPILFIWLFLIPMLGTAQTPADWWYFGQNAGMHFDNSTPVVDFDGQINALEGCAAISDNEGNLLFYTDGIFVFDSTHTQMPNGFGLMGWSSSTHSGVIVPKPANPNLYYIFTVDATENGGAGGFRHSLVDMTLNGGLGDVIFDSTNILLFDSTSEKIAAYPHSNNSDIWVVGHRIHTSEYWSYRVTSSGVPSTPVASNIGMYLDYPNSGNSITRGYLRFNPGGNLLASAILSKDTVELMDFNRTTGELTNLRNLSFPSGFLPYGLEFSPSGQYLYVSGWGFNFYAIYQFDVSLGTESAIQASMDTIDRVLNLTSGALQLGLDGKIYFAQVGGAYLGTISEPDMPAPQCNFADSGFFLEGLTSRYGLPTFIQSFLLPSLQADNYCFGDSTAFYIDSALIDSVDWNFGDPSTGINNTSELFTPSHVFSDTGLFSVYALVHIDTITDTVAQEVYIYPRQTIDLGEDTALCTNDTITLFAGQPFASLLWDDGSSADSILVTTTDTVWATVYGVCDTVSDTVFVRFDLPLTFDLGPDSTLCEGTPYELDAELNVFAQVSWNTGDTVDSIFATESGTYKMTAENACNTVEDSVTLVYIPIPGASLLPPDTINCFDNSIVFTRPQEDSITYIWSDSTSKKNYTVDSTESIWLAAFNECGFSVDTLNVIFNGEILSELGEDTNICEGDSILLIATHPGASYVWNTGDTADTAWTDQVESFNYVVTITYKACQTIESRRVDMDDFFCEPIDCSLQYANIFSPNGDGINDIFRAWSDCDIYSYSLYVYNRWGQLVHFDAHASFGWDGTSNGQPAPPGVYYFVIDFLDNVVVDEDRKTYHGSFTLVR